MATDVAAGDLVKPAKRAVASWVLYDLANTIFSINIITAYFPLWVITDMGGRDGDYGLARTISAALIFLSAPFIGALSDQAPRRIPFLIGCTVLCCTFTALLGTGGLIVSLALFAVANYFFQAGLLFYEPLLTVVSTETNRGKIGGMGVGLGYFGSFIGIGMGLALLSADPSAKPTIFRLTALLFLVFAIPCFLFVRERTRIDVVAFGWQSFRRALRELRNTIPEVRRYPHLTRFLIGRIFYSDAANTIIAFMTIYVTQEIGFTESQAQFVLLVGIGAAVIGGLAWGVVVDWINPKRTLMIVLGLWAVIFAGTALIALLDLPSWLFWLIAPLAGIALGGTWAADRPLMIRLTPPRRLGQFYGLYAMVGRFGAILGPLMWTAVVDWLGWGRPVAVASLLVMVVISAVVLLPVKGDPTEWSPEESLPVARS